MHWLALLCFIFSIFLKKKQIESWQVWEWTESQGINLVINANRKQIYFLTIMFSHCHSFSPQQSLVTCNRDKQLLDGTLATDPLIIRLRLYFCFCRHHKVLAELIFFATSFEDKGVPVCRKSVILQRRSHGDQPYCERWKSCSKNDQFLKANDKVWRRVFCTRKAVVKNWCMPLSGMERLLI